MDATAVSYMIFKIQTEADLIAVTDLVITDGEYMGGVTDPENGDSLQFRIMGLLVDIYLDKTYGDTVPGDDEILAHVEAIDVFPSSRSTAYAPE